MSCAAAVAIRPTNETVKLNYDDNKAGYITSIMNIPLACCILQGCESVVALWVGCR